MAAAADRSLLAAAVGGDEPAFVELTGAHRRALHVHCYRMLGSLDDADDALQETLLRAWRGLAGYAPRASLSAWLHRIATNVCLRMIERRERDRAAHVEAHLQPFPDRLLEEVAAEGPDPAEEAVGAEAVGLAFIVALQLLSPRERSVLLLREVLSWPASEVADVLGTSVAAVNSALQRARARLERERDGGGLAREHAPAGGAAERRVMELFQAAWAAADFEAIRRLLAEDALLTMPPVGARISGRDAVVAFFSTQPLEGRIDLIPLVGVRANGQPALAAYADEAGEGTPRAYGVMVFAIEGDRIAGITGFPEQPDLFTALGLATEL